MLTSRSALHPLAASRRDRDEFRRLDVELIVGAVVTLEVLPLGGRADSPHGPDGLSSSCKKSLREIADFKEPKFAPAGGVSLCANQSICYVGAVREPPSSAIARDCGRFSKRPYNPYRNRCGDDVGESGMGKLHGQDRADRGPLAYNPSPKGFGREFPSEGP